MVQKAMQVNAEQQKMQMVVETVKNQIFVSVFTNLAMEHAASGEPLTLESGRELADTAAQVATQVVNGYAGFVFEKMGLATVSKVDNPPVTG
jgi:hypothetical protein